MPNTSSRGGDSKRRRSAERDLFGLHEPPEKPHPSYRRLSRYDQTGLIWLLAGRPVVALTEATAAIQKFDRRHQRHPGSSPAPVSSLTDMVLDIVTAQLNELESRRRMAAA